MVTKFCAVVSNICGPSIWTLLHVTLLMNRILKWFLDFWKVYNPMIEHIVNKDMELL